MSNILNILTRSLEILGFDNVGIYMIQMNYKFSYLSVHAFILYNIRKNLCQFIYFFKFCYKI